MGCPPLQPPERVQSPPILSAESGMFANHFNVTRCVHLIVRGSVTAYPVDYERQDPCESGYAEGGGNPHRRQHPSPFKGHCWINYYMMSSC